MADTTRSLLLFIAVAVLVLSLDSVSGLRDLTQLKRDGKAPPVTRAAAAQAAVKKSGPNPPVIRWDTHLSRNYQPWQRETPYPTRVQVPKAVADYQRKAPPVSEEYCGQFSNPLTVELCSNYTSAPSSEARFCAARVWRGTDPATYFCAGLNQGCVNKELLNAQSNIQPFQICSPLPEGARCAMESPQFARHTPVCKQRKCSNRWGAIKPLSLPSRPIWANPISAGQVRTSLVKQPTPLLPWTKPKETFSMVIDTRVKGKEIPHGFLGTSHEWDRIQDYGEGDTEAWARIWRQMGPRNILRVGGASQDFMRAVPPARQWEGLVKLHNTSGTRFIIGVPLYGDNIPLTKAVMDAAQKYLGPIGALEGLELGNEPMYWQCPRIGGWDQKGRFVPGWGGFADYFHRVANNVSGCATGAKGGAVTKLIGPAWDNLNTMPPNQIRQVLDAGKCYIQTVSIHYYPYYTKGNFDPHVLVSEDLMREAVRNVSLTLRTIEPYGYKLRITEANSISGGGEYGTSDSFAAALWTIDISMEFAQAGVESLHFHWGKGGAPAAEEPVTGGAPDYTGVKTHFCNNDTTSCPSPRVVWFGYQMFQRAVSPLAAGEDTISDGRPAKFLRVNKATGTKGCYGSLKVWPVIHSGKTKGQEEVRVLVLNKDDTADCSVDLQLTGLFGDGQATRMTSGSKLLYAKADARLAGQWYTNYSGQLSGKKVTEPVQALYRADGKLQRSLQGADPRTEYNVEVPKASALLLVARTARPPST